MKAQDTFTELQEFWCKAYSTLDVRNSDVKSTLENWVSKVLTADGLSSESRKLFSCKLPEPFFGHWMAENGNLLVDGKTIVVLINPGDGIDYHQCADPDISIVGRPHWQLLKEFYTTGAINHLGKDYHLLYTRKLQNPTYDYCFENKDFAWGWWKSHWENMLRAINETDEDDSFLTLELFAYSSRDAKLLDINVVNALYSSRLATQLIINLIQDESAQPKRIILVGKREKIWQPIFQEQDYKFFPMKPKNKGGKPRAYQICFNDKSIQVPVILLEQAQKMWFPTPDSGAQEIFGWD